MLCAHSASAILCWSLSKSNRLDPTNATFSSAAAGLKQPAGLWGMPTESTLTAGETLMVLVLSSQALRYIAACSITNKLWWDRPHCEALLPLCLWCAKSEQERNVPSKHCRAGRCRTHTTYCDQRSQLLFLSHQVAGDPQCQDWGWHIFRVFENLGKVKSGSCTNMGSALSVSTSRQSSPCAPSFLFANLSTLLFCVHTAGLGASLDLPRPVTLLPKLQKMKICQVDFASCSFTVLDPQMSSWATALCIEAWWLMLQALAPLHRGKMEPF